MHMNKHKKAFILSSLTKILEEKTEVILWVVCGLELSLVS